mmetsp:Transcript_30649/g.82004  ORF Transcript_30649/g.82004 Transcript_30649/m.82004 type:complete len:102 (-) Transcript_30649:166-471(-)
MVVTWNRRVARHAAGRFAQYPVLLEEGNPFSAEAAEAAGSSSPPAEDMSRRLVDSGGAVDQAIYRGKALGLFESQYASHPVVVMVEDPWGRASLSFTYTNC